MIKRCKECNEPFDSNKTTPRTIGYGQEINDLFASRRPHSDLCGDCLIAQILSEREKSSATQD